MLIDSYRFGQQAPTPFYANDIMTGTGWVSAYWPAAFHHDSKTYIIWQFVGSADGIPVNTRKGASIATYDHTAGVWSDRYTAFNFSLTNDNHGVPSMVVDADGYVHCFGGAHSDPLKYSVSTNADDITKWTRQPDISGSTTYPHPVLVGSTIYLFGRDDSDSNQRVLTLRTATPVAGVATFSAAASILDLGADSRVYMTEAYAIGTKIHFTASRADAADTVRKHVYYLIYDTTTGDVSNYDESVTVAAVDLPVDLTTANASFRIFDSGSNDGAMPSFAFDTSGNAHVVFCDGTSSPYPMKHMMLSGGSWTSPETIASVADLAPGLGPVTTFSLVQGASGTMQVWYPSSGNMTRLVRSSAGVWGSEETIVSAGTFNLASNVAVLNAHADLRVVFSENVGSAVDANAERLKLYAYGDSGFIHAIDAAEVDPFWESVVFLSAGGARDASTSFIDESPHTFGASFNGNAQVDTAQSKFAQSSIVFDGSGDYLSVASSDQWSVSSGDFAFECWVRLNEVGRVQGVFNRRSGNSEFAFSITNTNILAATLYGAGGPVVSLSGSTAMTTGQWYHLALCRSGTTTRLFLDGVLEASGTQTGAPASNSQVLAIGRDLVNPGTRDLNGWVEEIRITRAARYTSAFTPPSARFPRK